MVALLTDSFGLKSSKLAQLDSTKFDEEPKILELALTALFLSAYISKIVFFGNSRIFVKILYIGVRIFYGFVGQWIP